MRLNIIRGRRQGGPTPEEARTYPYSTDELAYLEQYSRSNVAGDPQQGKEPLEHLAEVFQTTDLGIVTICYDFSKRVRSYELIAEACGLLDSGPRREETPADSSGGI